MRTSLIVFAAALGLADAANNILSPYGALDKRQGEAFDPGEGIGSGATCVEAFGPGYVECRPETATQHSLCINPGLGETCCNNQWGCPADSFCLVNGLCCPTGLDPKTCAAQNSVSLPADFGATTTSTPKDTATSTTAVSTTPHTMSTPGTTSTNTNTITTTTTTNTATTAPTRSVGNGTTTRTATTSRPVFTAGGYQERSGFAAVLLGLAAAIVL